MSDSGESDEILCGFGDIAPDPPDKRPTCSRCRRPLTVCWCAYLPRNPISVRTKVTILQHPYEASRRLRTAPMLYYGLQPGQCTIIQGKKFKLNKYPDIERLIQDPNTILLFPGEKSQDLASLHPRSDDIQYNLVLLDGTWMQARGLFCQNPFMRQLKQVQLSSPCLSEYIIRTQPTDRCLSTLETAVYAIALLENRPDIIQPLLSPLRAMCKFQIEHGALKHHSKQYLIDNGLYKKQEPPTESHALKSNRNHFGS
ncbi:hypothetical protein LSH36_79g03034 [Paralvinella palmiformis]|uniref:tRNA-uridine aminocarboxypropyltransferase n=1 Tax=Paralvinella palmiformis TaxID=53620 RepID=A0AAD9K299_9ANNE|nr:hypothetical protein LSH36_79g03034 [Paralvinella palmiformis]